MRRVVAVLAIIVMPQLLDGFLRLAFFRCTTYSPPPPLNGEAIRVWCPLGPLVYAGCSLASAA